MARHGDELELDIQRLDAKGWGIAQVTETEKLEHGGSGRGDNQGEENGHKKPRQWTIRVPYAIPGERVRVVVRRGKKGGRKLEAQLLEVLQPHGERVEPRCAHFSRCGGCVWQHVNYPEQLAIKEAYVKSCLKSAGLDERVVKPILGMEHPWHYRNKMEFTFSPEGRLGLHEQGDFRAVIPLDDCLIAAEEMVRAAREVAAWAREHRLRGYDKLAHQGLLRHLMVRQSFATKELMVALFATEPLTSAGKSARSASGAHESLRGDLAQTSHETLMAHVAHQSHQTILPHVVDDLVQRLRERCPSLASLLWIVNRGVADKTEVEQMTCLFGREYIEDELSGFRYRLKPQTFFQTNPLQAERLVEIALEQGKPRADERVIDLFCGVGTFSLPFAKRSRELVGIEIVEASVQAARQNAAENGVANARFITADARRGLDQVLNENQGVDLLLLDPPRSGAGGKVMRKIGRARPKRVVYVSCNPVTLAEDCAELLRFGYELMEVRPVDMFPHTVHVECVVSTHFTG